VAVGLVLVGVGDAVGVGRPGAILCVPVPTLRAIVAYATQSAGVGAPVRARAAGGGLPIRVPARIQ